MKKSRFTAEQIIRNLKEGAGQFQKLSLSNGPEYTSKILKK